MLRAAIRSNLLQRVTPYAYAVGQGVLYVLCLPLALSLACIHRGENGTSSSSRKLSWHGSHMFSFMAAPFPDSSRTLNTWSGAAELLQGLCHCRDGSRPGFDFDMIVAEEGLFPSQGFFVFGFLVNYVMQYDLCGHTSINYPAYSIYLHIYTVTLFHFFENV